MGWTALAAAVMNRCIELQRPQRPQIPIAHPIIHTSRCPAANATVTERDIIGHVQPNPISK